MEKHDSVISRRRLLKATGAAARPAGMPSLGELGNVAAQLTATAPVLEHVLASSMVKGETIDVLSLLGEAATEGMAKARSADTRITTDIAAKAAAATNAQKEFFILRILSHLIEV